MNWKRLLYVLLATVIAGLLLAGCSKSAQNDKGTVLRFAIGAEPQTLDPRKATGIPESLVDEQIFEGLCALDAHGNPIPGVAKSWDISPDGLTYTFHLRDNAKWSNGDPVTAQDFEYAWKTALSPQLASEYAEQLYYIKNGEKYNKGQVGADQVGVKAVNDKTLVVKLEKPTAYFLTLMAFHTYYPVDKKVAEAHPDWAANPKTIIGNGPFKMKSWTHNSMIVLVKNNSYWDREKVKLTQINMILSEDVNTVLSMFENNQVDLTNNPPPVSEIPRLKKEGFLKVYPYLGTYYYEFNTQKAPFNNPKVRMAFALAINREAIVKDVTKSGEKPATGWVPYGLQDVKPGSDFRKVGGVLIKDNDIATAKKLLAEAGYPDGKGLPPITLLYNTQDLNKAIAEAIQEMWKKNLGVQVNITNQEWKVYLQSRTTGNFQVARAGWIGDYADPMTFIDMMQTGNGNNRARWSNPQYDKLVNLAKSTLDPAVRMKAMHEAEAILMKAMPIMPIYFYTQPILERPNLKGIVRTVDGSVYLKEAYFK
jgi:oligopeptide transport system substrate-binding protein